MKKIIAGLFVFVAVLSTKANAQQKDIVDVAAGSPAHTTLVAAVKAAGLVETLKGKGPFTVFAPTNDAFGKLPAGTVETLLKPEAKGALTGILTYHVVAGKLDAKAVGEAIKFSIIDVLYQMTIRKWIINIGASIESTFAGSLAGSAAGA